MQPKVSVIVPNYNHAPYLKQRLESIFNQTFQDYEVIILDDCSTDDSRDVIEKYRSKPQTSHIIYNEVNCGSPFKQWAKGFNLAKGDYIWIAESDDWAEPNFLESLVPHLENNHNIALAFSASKWVYPDYEENVSIHFHDFEMNGIDFIKNRMICGNSIHNASAVIFRRNNLHKISDSYTQFKGSGDYLFWVNLCETGDVYFLAKQLNYFRKHKSNTTQKCNSNGITYKEDYSIFSYMEKKEYLSSWARKCTASFYLAKVKKSDGYLTSKDAIKVWENEIKHPFISQTFCFFIGLCTRISPFFLRNILNKKISWSYYYSNYSTLELIWNMFHLPNTNIRRFFDKN